MIPKKIHYVWFWRWEKPENFKNILDSWKKFCPDCEIIEWNEENFDIWENYYCKKFYNKGLYAFASDYARIKILYEQGGIYLDIDMELLQNIDNFLKDKAFIWFQDIFTIWVWILWSEAKNPVLKDILDVYENKKTRVTIPNLITRLLRKKYNLKKYNSQIQDLKYIKVYPKEYFYPYAFFEKSEDKKITKNTYAIHHYWASWLPSVVTKVFFPIIWFVVKKFFHSKKT